jgi:hypothetical protein
MNKDVRTVLTLVMALAIPLAGCTAAGAGAGGYAGYQAGCKEDNTREECAAATGVGAVGGAAIGEALD